MEKFIPLALDTGYATTKFAIMNLNGEIFSNRFYSRVGTADQIFQTELWADTRPLEYGVVKMMDGEPEQHRSYYVHTLTKHSRNLLPILYKDWVKDLPYLVLSRAAMGMALKLGGYATGNKFEGKIRLMTGLPVAYYERGEDVDAVCKVFNGVHRFAVGGCEFNLEVSLAPEDVIPQPSGAYHDIVLNNDGFFREEFVDKELIGIIDIGNNTTDLAVIDEDQYMAHQSTSDNIGVAKFFHGVRDEVFRRHEVKLPINKVEDIIRDANYEVTVKGQRVDVSDIVENARRMTADAICFWINSVWESRNRMDAIFVAGGGASVFADELRNYFPEATFVEDGTKANVLGYYKLLLCKIGGGDVVRGTLKQYAEEAAAAAAASPNSTIAPPPLIKEVARASSSSEKKEGEDSSAAAPEEKDESVNLTAPSKPREQAPPPGEKFVAELSNEMIVKPADSASADTPSAGSFLE